MDSVNKWLTLAANVGVIAGIVFLGFEIRQNTNSVESASIDNLTNLSHVYFMSLALDPELNRIWNIGIADSSKLNDSELSRFTWFERTRTLRLQAAFFQWSRGTLGDDDFQFYESFICNEDNADHWVGARATFQRNFVDYVESC